MQQIIFFFIRNKNFLLFGILFLISISLTIKSHSFHSTKFTSSANFLSGGIYTAKSNITSYFGLKEENQNLINENLQLRKLLETYKDNSDLAIDSSQLPVNYKFVSAQVITIPIRKPKIYSLLKKGPGMDFKLTWV